MLYERFEILVVMQQRKTTLNATSRNDSVYGLPNSNAHLAKFAIVTGGFDCDVFASLSRLCVSEASKLLALAKCFRH